MRSSVLVIRTQGRKWFLLLKLLVDRVQVVVIEARSRRDFFLHFAHLVADSVLESQQFLAVALTDFLGECRSVLSCNLAVSTGAALLARDVFHVVLADSDDGSLRAFDR